LRNCSSMARERDFSVLQASTLGLRHIQPPVYWVLFAGSKLARA